MPSSKPFITDEMTLPVMNLHPADIPLLDYTEYIPPVDLIESKALLEVAPDILRQHPDCGPIYTKCIRAQLTARLLQWLAPALYINTPGDLL
jgi:hypothetical protein